jgi:hypothetical protein
VKGETVENTPDKIKGIERFLQDHIHEMPGFYNTYTWDNDSPEKSHQALFDLEMEIFPAAKSNSFNREHLIKIAEWGGHPNPKKINCPDPLRIPLYSGNRPALCLFYEPVNAICMIEGRVGGFGPTFSSKLLHFAVPRIFGALDTRLVRIFGMSSEDPESYQFLNLNVLRPDKGRPSIPKTQENWPEEYGTWVAILNQMADYLNRNQIACKHPEQYYHENLREKDTWLPADVETALFSYASKVLDDKA